MNKKNRETNSQNWLNTLFSFRGTLGRLPFLGLVLLANIVPMVLMFLASSTGSDAFGIFAMAMLFAGIWIMLAALAKRGRTVGWNPLATVVGYFIWLAVVDYILSLPSVALTITLQTMQHPILGTLLTQLFGGAYIVWLILLPDQSKKDEELEESEINSQKSEQDKTEKGEKL